MIKNRDKMAPFVYLAAVFLFFVLSFVSGITRIYGFTLFPDEFGYWLPAASLAGYDWSGVAAHSSYYSFGYGLFLAPLFLIGKNALWMYRTALCMNAALLWATLILLSGVIKKLIPESSRQQRILSAGLAVCYPVFLLYRNMTMAEVLLVFCLVLVCRLLLWFLERPTFCRFAVTGMSAVYMYTVHMRSLPVLCASVGCMIVVWVHRRVLRNRVAYGQWCALLGAVVIIVAAFLSAEYVKDVIQARFYGHADQTRLSVNDYSGQLQNVIGLFTWRGCVELVVSLIGKVYYLAFAGFGLFFAGVRYFIRRAADKTADFGGRMFGLFVLASAVGEILICAVYTRGYGRIDALCYGRYDEMILVLLMAFGCFEVLHWKHPMRYLAGLILGGVPVTAMLDMIVKSHGLTNINGGYFIAGLSYLLRNMPFEPKGYFWKAYALASILTLLLFAMLMLVRRRREYLWLLLVWIGIETLLGIHLSETMVYRQSRVRYQDMRMVTALKELRGADVGQTDSNWTEETVSGRSADTDAWDAGNSDETGRRIVCFGDDETGIYASVVQFELRNEIIYFFTPEEADRLSERDLVLVCETQDRDILEQKYAKRTAYGIFYLYYNE